MHNGLGLNGYESSVNPTGVMSSKLLTSVLSGSAYYIQASPTHAAKIF